MHTRHLNSVLRGCLLVSIPLLGACASGSADDHASTAAPTAGATQAIAPPTVRRAVRPATDTAIAIQTSPEAVCTLHSTSSLVSTASEGDAHPLHLDADDLGFVRVHIQTDAPAGKLLTMALDCMGSDGVQSTYPLEVRSDSEANDTSEADADALPKGVTRPALAGDPTTLTDGELVSHGYPRHPDAKKGPEALEKWRTMISTPYQVVRDRRIEHPEMRHSPTLPLPPPSPELPKLETGFNNGTSSTWSGAVMTNPDVRFWQIQSDWNVPYVETIPTNIGYGAAAEWIGLGNQNYDLYQSGSDSVSANYIFYEPFGGTYNWTFTTYSTWIENWPYAPYYLPNFPTNYGDHLSVDIFVADQNGTTWWTTSGWKDITAADNSIWFMIYNTTQGTSYWGTLPRTSQFQGETAEFVMERPEVNGGSTNLADFVWAFMYDCYYADTWGGYTSLDYNGAAPNVGVLNNWTMVNSGRTLADAYIYANNTTPGGGNLMWIWQGYN